MGKGDVVTVNHKQFGLMCEICFDGLTPEACAVDAGGQRWDVCAGECARQAGIVEGGPGTVETAGSPVQELRGARIVQVEGEGGAGRG
jgi:hypothetical protein